MLAVDSPLVIGQTITTRASFVTGEVQEVADHPAEDKVRVRLLLDDGTEKWTTY